MKSIFLLLFVGLCLAPSALAEDTKPKKEVEYVKLTFTANTSAQVWFGRKLLGTTPVTYKRRKNSGPVDVVFKAGGYLPVASRGYTWSNDRIAVKMTARSQAHTLFGYKKPAEGDEEVDGEAAP